MLRLPVPAPATTRGFFTREEAFAVGWTRTAIATQLDRGNWQRLAPGRYALATAEEAAPDQRHALVALAKAFGRNLVVRRDSAGCVHGMRVARTPVAVSTRHRSEFLDEDVVCVADTFVTNKPRTVIDCARYLSPREGLVVADSALRMGVSLDDLVTQLAAIPQNGKGAQRATLVVSEADARAESAFESISRYAFIRADLPRPTPQAWIGNRRVDFLWERYRVIGEADGIGKYGATTQDVRASLRAERIRQGELEDAGYAFVRWVWEEIWFRPQVVVSRVVNKLAERGYRPR